jgi:hypothetical protein
MCLPNAKCPTTTERAAGRCAYRARTATPPLNNHQTTATYHALDVPKSEFVPEFIRILAWDWFHERAPQFELSIGKR